MIDLNKLEKRWDNITDQTIGEAQMMILVLIEAIREVEREREEAWEVGYDEGIEWQRDRL